MAVYERESLKIKWHLFDITSIATQKQNDTSNCGVFVSQYLKRLVVSNYDLFFSNSQATLDIFRKEMSEVLLANKEN